MQELDFENEARNMERCRRDLSSLPWLHVPHVETSLSSRRVLTAEWIDGCRVTDKPTLEKMGLDKADVRREGGGEREGRREGGKERGREGGGREGEG